MLSRLLSDKRKEILNRTFFRWGKRRKESRFLDIFSKRPPHIIAEIKRASPSKGIIREDLCVAKFARLYAEGGADAISVLTDSHFMGTLDDLLEAKSSNLPILQKDFIIDESQIYESASIGADAILIIVAALSKEELSKFVDLSLSLGLEPLVEVHTEKELELALSTKTNIIGINNRDLKTFKVDINRTKTLAKLVPKDRFLICESGIKSRKDVEEFMEIGIDTFLIGEAIVRKPDPSSFIRELKGI